MGYVRNSIELRGRKVVDEVGIRKFQIISSILFDGVKKKKKICGQPVCRSYSTLCPATLGPCLEVSSLFGPRLLPSYLLLHPLFTHLFSLQVACLALVGRIAALTE